ncbi:381_t:CDS:2 [Funneliformis geosporum]|uniref:381_t:CDS:1 n=1 Tax=Funneliformis geosporum TaxID=1117311 RepID=A0A9W4SKB0_9GLOM|nr:381_t:CDS:2 [Funneliformis geosporum]
MPCMNSNNSELFLSKLIQEFNLDSINNEGHLHILHQAEKLFLKVFDVEDSIDTLIDKLIVLLIKTHDEGNDFNETKHFIIQCIFHSNKNSNDIFEWLKENQVESKHVFLLGFFYFNNINFEKNENEAFQLFLCASTNDYPIAQVYLAKCYENGCGIEINYNLAFHWIQKAVRNNSIFGKLNLGIYYEKSIGIEKDLKKAFYLYQEAADNENLSGLYNLGRCYELDLEFVTI